MATKNKDNKKRNLLIGLGAGIGTLAVAGTTIALTRKPNAAKQLVKQAVNTIERKPPTTTNGVAQVRQYVRRVKGKTVTVKAGTRRIKVNKHPNVKPTTKVSVVPVNKVDRTKFNSFKNKDEYLNLVKDSQDRGNQYVLQARETSALIAQQKGVTKLGKRKQLERLQKEIFSKRNEEREYRRKLATNLQKSVGGNKIASQGKRGSVGLGNIGSAEVTNEAGRKTVKAVKPRKYNYEFSAPIYFGQSEATFARKRGSKDKKKRKIPVRSLGTIGAGAGIGGFSTAAANYLADRKQLKSSLAEAGKQRKESVRTVLKPVKDELRKVNKQLKDDITGSKNSISLKSKNPKTVETFKKNIAEAIEQGKNKQSALNERIPVIKQLINQETPSSKALKNSYIKKLAKTSGKGALIGGAIAGLGYGAYKLSNRKKDNGNQESKS
jgi:hypothetical protein